MLECSTTITLLDLGSELRMSLHQCGEEEAKRFKWIESEKAGRDLGETAIRTWIGRHWNGFLRHRWLEHLQGKTFWIELDQGDFGLLQTAFQASPLIDPILEHFKHGRENLDIILWAQDNQDAHARRARDPRGSRRQQPAHRMPLRSIAISRYPPGRDGAGSGPGSSRRFSRR